VIIILILFALSLLILIVAEVLSIRAANSTYYKLCGLPPNGSLVSVIMAARNEEPIILRALESLEQQNDENMELVLVIDRCTDSTLQTVRDFAERATFEVKITVNTEEPPAGNSPKAFLLQLGIELASGDVFLFTDADCAVPSAWVSSYRKLFSDDNVGLAMGAVGIAPVSSLLTAFQSFDHTYRSFYAAGCSGAGVPTGAYGNNLGIRRSCYESLGGFSALPASVTEDAVLVAAVRGSSYKIAAAASDTPKVESLPQKRFKPYLAQSLRWAMGAVHSPDFKTSLFYNLLMIALTVCNLALIISPFIPALLLFPAAGYAYIIVSALIAGFYMRAGAAYWVFLIPSVFLFFFFYQISFIRSLFHSPIIWKNSKITA